MATLREPRKQHLKVNQTLFEMDPNSRSVSNLTEDFEDKVVAAKKQLEFLQQEQELIEKQKQEIAELNLQKQEFITGQINITEKLATTVTLLDRELYEMRQETEELEQARQCFTDHQGRIDNINTESWAHENLKEELEKSLALLDLAEDEYDEAIDYFSKSKHSTAFNNRTKAVKTKSSSVSRKSGEFTTSFKQGFAFNLPLLILGSAALVAFLVK